MKVIINNKKYSFKITEEEAILSKKIFKGKNITVVLSNGIDVNIFDNNINIIKFPENYCALNDFGSIFTNIINGNNNDTCIITNSLVVLTGIPKALVRVAKVNGLKLLKTEYDTFCGNIGEILIDTNDGVSYMPHVIDYIRKIQEDIKANLWKTDDTVYESIKKDISIVGGQMAFYNLNKFIEK